jgi:hypothetical protein
MINVFGHVHSIWDLRVKQPKSADIHPRAGFLELCRMVGMRPREVSGGSNAGVRPLPLSRESPAIGVVRPLDNRTPDVTCSMPALDPKCTRASAVVDFRNAAGD